MPEYRTEPVLFNILMVLFVIFVSSGIIWGLIIQVREAPHREPITHSANTK